MLVCFRDSFLIKKRKRKRNNIFLVIFGVGKWCLKIFLGKYKYRRRTVMTSLVFFCRLSLFWSDFCSPWSPDQVRYPKMDPLLLIHRYKYVNKIISVVCNLRQFKIQCWRNQKVCAAHSTGHTKCRSIKLEIGIKNGRVRLKI